MNNPNPGSTSGDGGFLPPTPSSLLSPAPSSTTGLLRSNRFLTSLPHPRHQPIRPNSSKEFTVREYATSKLSLIARRFVKKFSGSSPGSEIAGYNTFAEVCTDFDAMINILWLSGTPYLQVPFLLRIATEITDYILSFPPAPKPTFKIFRKLDHCFASLACGKDIVTGEDLPGFQGGPNSGMTTTDLVRCRSTAESTMVLLSSFVGDEMDESESDGDGDDSDGTGGVDVDADATSELDKLYENTLLKIGERLGEDIGSGR